MEKASQIWIVTNIPHLFTPNSIYCLPTTAALAGIFI